MRAMKVKLTYFKPSGKYYSDGVFETDTTPTQKQFDLGINIKPLYQIWEEVERMRDVTGNLPDLCDGCGKEFDILVEVPDHPHAHPHIVRGRQ